MNIYQLYANTTKAYTKGEYNPTNEELLELRNALWELDNKYRLGVTTELTDDEYDQLHAIYYDLTKDMVTGEDERIKTDHDYPNLKGTLKKVHYITEMEKKNDPFQVKEYNTLERWIHNTMKKLNQPATLGFYRKIDGMSIVFTLDAKRRVLKAVTRGKVSDGTNEGNDKTKLFKGIPIMGCIPSECTGKAGLKVEAVMSFEQFARYNKQFFNDELPDARAGIISLIHSLDWTKNHGKYITLAPLMYEYEGVLYPVSIPKYGPVETLKVYPDQELDLDALENAIRNTRKSIEDFFLPCDGIVVRWMDKFAIDTLGRSYSTNTNNFEIAYKFRPQGYYSKIIDIRQDIGWMGNVSYTAIFEPIEIDGRKIKHANLGSYDKMTAANFAIGDTCLITVNIIPRIGKDAYCEQHTSGNAPIEPIKKCPYCHQDLNIEGQPHCDNPKCSTKQMGKIYEFVKIMKIKKIGPGIIETLFHEGIVRKVQDLFDMESRKKYLYTIDGIGKKQAKVICDAVKDLTATEAQILASLCIKDLKYKRAKIIMEHITLEQIFKLKSQPHIIDKVANIKGIGKSMVEKFKEGIAENMDLLEFLVKHITIKDDVKATIRVVFTGFRNPEFENYLSKGGVVVDDSVTKSTNIVIALNPDNQSGKVMKAKKLGIPVISLSDAFAKFKFKT